MVEKDCETSCNAKLEGIVFRQILSRQVYIDYTLNQINTFNKGGLPWLLDPTPSPS
jgi:hypothetical protein